MLWVIRIITFTLLFFFSSTAMAQYKVANVKLNRASVSSIKIIGSDVDNISFFVKDNNKKVYRFSNISEKDADTILKRLDSEAPISVNCRSVEKKKYMDVVDWE
jgi:hypothetical protein